MRKSTYLRASAANFRIPPFLLEAALLTNDENEFRNGP